MIKRVDIRKQSVQERLSALQKKCLPYDTPIDTNFGCWWIAAKDGVDINKAKGAYVDMALQAFGGDANKPFEYGTIQKALQNNPNIFLSKDTLQQVIDFKSKRDGKEQPTTFADIQPILEKSIEAELARADKSGDGIIQLSEIDAPIDSTIKKVEPIAMQARVAVNLAETNLGYIFTDSVKLEFEKIVESLPDKIRSADERGDKNGRVSLEEMLPTIKEVLEKLEEAKNSQAPLQGQAPEIEQGAAPARK
jgi:hypothetical protein